MEKRIESLEKRIESLENKLGSIEEKIKALSAAPPPPPPTRAQKMALYLLISSGSELRVQLRAINPDSVNAALGAQQIVDGFPGALAATGLDAIFNPADFPDIGNLYDQGAPAAENNIATSSSSGKILTAVGLAAADGYPDPPCPDGADVAGVVNALAGKAPFPAHP